MHVDPGALAAVLSITGILIAAVSGVIGHLTARRAASGKVSTSEASVLWEQAQDMRRMLLAEKSKAEEQRDRIMESYTGQIVPVLTSISTLIEGLSRSVGEVLALDQRNSLYLRERGAHVAVPAEDSTTEAER